jgi:putative ATP-dependent endonuclease of the OLD family
VYLSRVYIKNYRSIKELDLALARGKNVLVGRNNAGKSNIIRAVDLVLGESNPTYFRSENITEGDFFAWREDEGGRAVTRAARDLFIWCELRREKGEALNYDELYKATSLPVYSRLEGWTVDSKPIKVPARISQHMLPHVYETIFDLNEDNAERDWINPRKREMQPLERQFDDKHSFAFAFRATRDEAGRVTKDIRFLYREDQFADWVLSFRAPLRNELLQSAIIPSFRDPQSQLRLTNWTWYGKLMRHLTAGQGEADELQEAFDRVKSVADRVFGEVKEKVASSALRVAFPGTDLQFQFNTEARADLYKSTALYVDDGYKSQLIDKGSGVQSAVTIGLFQYYTRHVNTVTSALLSVEEPELYLHPHARRVISDRLDDFLDGGKHQVILSTHSSDFIRSSSGDLNLILIRKEKDATHATPVSLREFRHLLVNDGQHELFFADKLIVCEGLDDYVIKAVARESFPGELEAQNVSVVAVGGKNYLSQLVRLALRLGIKCFLVADFEYLLRDESDTAKEHGTEPQEHLLTLGADFFNQECTFGAAGAKAYQFIEKLRSQIKDADEKAFYTATSAAQVNQANIQQVLDRLRLNGVCILGGELESLSKDYTFLSPYNKLTMEKVYALNQRIVSGGKVADALNVNEITEFLKVVFER